MKFHELKGEGTIESPKQCIWCQTNLKEENKLGFCCPACEELYWESWDNFFGFIKGNMESDS